MKCFPTSLVHLPLPSMLRLLQTAVTQRVGAGLQDCPNTSEAILCNTASPSHARFHQETANNVVTSTQTLLNMPCNWTTHTCQCALFPHIVQQYFQKNGTAILPAVAAY